MYKHKKNCKTIYILYNVYLKRVSINILKKLFSATFIFLKIKKKCKCPFYFDQIFTDKLYDNCREVYNLSL